MNESPLTSRARAAGLELVDHRGALVPVTYGDTAAEVQAARAGAAIISLDWLTHVHVTGRHRARFMHNMTTCQIKALTPGQGNYGMVITIKGRLVALFHLDCEAERLVLEVARERVAPMIEQLVKYRVADDVRFEESDAALVLSVVGPQAEALVGDIAAVADEAFAWADGELDGIAVRRRRAPHRAGLPAWDLRVAATDAEALWDALVGRGATPMGVAAWRTLQVESGWPVEGGDLTDAHIVLESERLAETVDWNKGCYIGQEVLCMLNDRGEPARRLRAIRPLAGGVITTGAEVRARDADKIVGRVGTTAHSAALGQEVALAVIKRKSATPGTVLRLDDGSEAEVLALPIGG